MALTLPDNFKNDIQGRDANIYPFVLIDDDGMNIRLSTNAITIGDFFYKPLLLNIPSLKESIDIEKRNYKISSITLDISNYEYEGVRFSDLVGDTSLINMEVQILWGSQSTVSHATAFQVYNGSIRRYTHDDEKVRLVVEDRSQATLHKDLPLPDNYLTGDDVPDKYKNKPIPMVYGHVDRSPCVFKKFGDDATGAIELELYADSADVTFNENQKDWYKDGIYNINTDPLWIPRDDIYYNVLKSSQFYDGSTGDNYVISTNSEGIKVIKFLTNYSNATEGGNLELGLLKIPMSVNCYTASPWDNDVYTNQNISNITNHTNSFATIDFTKGGTGVIKNGRIFIQFSTYSDDDIIYVKHYFLADIFYKVTWLEDDTLDNVNFRLNRLHGTIDGDIVYQYDRYYLPGELINETSQYPSYNPGIGLDESA